MNDFKNNNKLDKCPLWKRIISILIALIIIVFIVFVIASNFDTISIPKNSVTIVVKDQSGNSIDGLKIRFSAGDKDYNIEFDKLTKITQDNLKPGDYDLYFEYVPDNYNCEVINDNFTLSKGDKVKLEYICNKIN